MNSAAHKRTGAVASACLISSGISRQSRLRGVRSFLIVREISFLARQQLKGR